ncbi:MAG: conjugal transfer protein TraI [Flavisolibacter sp.]
MKKIFFCISLMILVILISTFKVTAQDPISLIIKEGIKKVIVAIDLKIQRLQTKTIWLQDAQKVAENTMSKLRLDEITSWVQKQKDLYQNYFNELWKVKDIVSYYHKLKEIANDQITLVQAYHQAWNGIRKDAHFNAEEIVYIGRVYTGIIEASLKNLDQVSLVINSFTTQMADAKRMQIIDQASFVMKQNVSDLRLFNSQNIILSLQRSKDEHDIAIVKSLYGIQ